MEFKMQETEVAPEEVTPETAPETTEETGDEAPEADV